MAFLSSSPQQAVTSNLQRAGQLFGQKNYQAAMGLVDQVLLQAPNHSDALHLKGLLFKAQGNFLQAEDYLLRAMNFTETPEQIINNLANLYNQIESYDKAIAIYERLNTELGGYGDSYYHHCRLLLLVGDIQDAVAVNAAWKVSDILPSGALKLLIEARIEAALENTAAAREKFERVTGLVSGGFTGSGLTGSGIAGTGLMGGSGLSADLEARFYHYHAALERTAGNPNKAAELLTRAISLFPKRESFITARGAAYDEAGNFEAADHDFRTALAIDIKNAETHQALNGLYYTHGKQDSFGKSYALLKDIDEKSMLTRLDLAKLYLTSDQTEQAMDAIDSLYDACMAHESQKVQNKALMMKSQILDKRDEYGAAYEIIKPFVDKEQVGPDGYLIASRLAIRNEQYETALTYLDKYEQYLPDNQSLWAYRGLCWRLMGHEEKANWLMNPEIFIQTETCPVPAGYASRQEFLGALHDRLMQYHVTIKEPANQSLRGGTQTIGKLLSYDDPVIKDFKASITQTVMDYIKRLPDDDTHPLCRRKQTILDGQGIDFPASWSVRLTGGGYHVNHIHPMGWMSSAFYVAMDDSQIGEGGNDLSGWIKFGESSMRLGDKEHIYKYVKPEAGMLALFPSFMWHGTVPFGSDKDQGKVYRMTAPFDVVPR